MAAAPRQVRRKPAMAKGALKNAMIATGSKKGHTGNLSGLRAATARGPYQCEGKTDADEAQSQRADQFLPRSRRSLSNAAPHSKDECDERCRCDNEEEARLGMDLNGASRQSIGGVREREISRNDKTNDTKRDGPISMNFGHNPPAGQIQGPAVIRAIMLTSAFHPLLP